MNRAIRSTLTVGLLALVAWGAWAQEPSAPEGEAPAAGAKPAADAPPAPALPGFDLWTPALRERHGKLRAELDKLKNVRVEKTTELLEKVRAEADGSYGRARQIRNVHNMMVARALQQLVQEAEASLSEKGDFQWPDRVRRELTERVAALKARKDALDEHAAEIRRKILDRSFPDFQKALQTQESDEAPGIDAVREVYDRWVDATPPPEKTPEPAPAPEPGWTAPPAEPKDPEFMAQKGDADSWETYGRCRADVMGPEVLRLPIGGKRTDQRGSQANILSGRTTKWTYQVVKPLPEEPAALRLRRVEGARGVDVLEWPTRANGGALLVRTRTGDRYPIVHGFEVEAPAGAAAPARAEPAPAPEPANDGLAIPVETSPAGAVVVVDGEVYAENGRAVKAPCRVRMTPGKHTVKLVLPDYQDKTFEGFRALPGAAVRWRFVSEKTLPGKKLRVDAGKGWEPTGIYVDPLQPFWILASGTWICGSRGEACGPDGYPDTAAYHHYYAKGTPDPRILKAAPYGALLVRMGWRDKDPTAAVGAEKKLASRVRAQIYLSINEKAEADLKKDNRGALDVTIIVLPVKP